MRKFVLLFMCVLVVSLFGATTGKIVGRVYDASTGEGLPGVNVIVEGTTMGAATDPDGYFVILSVTPDRYDVTARMIGYRSLTITGVIIEADLTRTLEFALETEAIKVKGVTIKAKKPIIKKDATTSVSIVSAADMEATPVNTVQGVVARQAGVISSGGLHVRGGRSTEIVYVVNGVEMVDPMSGGFDSHIPQESVQETAVYTGGFGAEYGSAQSGVINVITKSGGSKFHFTLKARTNDAFGMERLQKFLDNNEEYDTTYIEVASADSNYGNFIPYRSYYISISPDGSDTVYCYVSPDGTDTSDYEENFDMLYHQFLSGRIDTIAVNDTLIVENWRPEKMKRIDFTFSGPLWGKKLRFFLGGEYSSEDGFHPNNENWEHTYTGKLTFKPTQAFKVVAHGLYSTSEWKYYRPQWKFHLGGLFDAEDYSYSYGINITHAINPKVIHEFKFNNYTTGQHYNLFEDGTYDLNNDGVIDDADKDGIDDFADEDHDRRVEINGEEKDFDWRGLLIYPFWMDKQNFQGYYYGGFFVFTWHEDKKQIYTGRWDITAQIGRIHEIKAGVTGKYYDIFEYSAQLASGGQEYGDWSEVNPYRISAYFQDKLEQESFVLNAGLRFDYLNPNSNNLPGDIYHPVPDTLINYGGAIEDPYYADVKWGLSPRIGLSFPITEYDKFHFTYGHYFQTPPMRYLFYNTLYNFTGGYPMVGNPNLDPEKTVSYEFGVQHAFNDEVLLDITGYMKDISGLTDTEQIFYTMTNYYTRYVNADYGHSKGIEVNFSKRRGGTPAWLTWDVNYTFGVSRGKSSSTRQNYDFIYDRSIVPTEERYLDWDQRHTIAMNIGLHAPEGEALFGIPGFDNSGITLTGSYGSGLPWTPPARTRIVYINTERLPYTLRVDMRFYKNVEIGQMKIGIFGDIYHLLEHENISGYYLNETIYANFGVPGGLYNDPRVYSAKRYMRLGLSIKW